MINQNVSDANSNFDRTVYDFETHAKIDNTEAYSVIVSPLNNNVVQIGKELGLPKGKHLVLLTVTAQVLASELHDADEEYSNAPDDDDLAQEDMAMKAAFQHSNGKVPHFGVSDLF